MNVDEIRKYCLAFPGATEALQWEDALCFKVSGKIFAVLGLDDLRFSFKCDPEAFAELIERPDIEPAPYVGRFKWVRLDRLDALPRRELEDLIRRSHEAVTAKVSHKRSGSRRKKQTKKRASNKLRRES